MTGENGEEKHGLR